MVEILEPQVMALAAAVVVVATMEAQAQVVVLAVKQQLLLFLVLLLALLVQVVTAERFSLAILTVALAERALYWFITKEKLWLTLQFYKTT
jgi:hypothetical protein